MTALRAEWQADIDAATNALFRYCEVISITGALVEVRMNGDKDDDPTLTIRKFAGYSPTVGDTPVAVKMAGGWFALGVLG